MFTYILLVFRVTQDPCFQDKVSLKTRWNIIFFQNWLFFYKKSTSQHGGWTDWVDSSPCANLSAATSSPWEDILHRYPEWSNHEDCHLLFAFLPEGRQSLPNLWLSMDGTKGENTLKLLGCVTIQVLTILFYSFILLLFLLFWNCIEQIVLSESPFSSLLHLLW